MRRATLMFWMQSLAICMISLHWNSPALAADPCLNPAATAVVDCLRPGSRGIRPGAPGPAPAAQAPGGTARAMVRPGRVDYTLPFATGSATPRPGALTTLDGFGHALSAPALAGVRFRVEGHADTTGDRQLNLTLSQRRAESVVAYLNATFPAATGRLTAVGKGQEDLPVPTPDQVNEPRNRIVRIVPDGS